MPRKPSSRPPRVPKYRLHKASGQAYVQFNNRRIYLGDYDAPQTREQYHRIIAEWEACGRRPLAAWNADGPRRPGVPADLTIAELLEGHHEHTIEYCRLPDGSIGTEPDDFRQALRPVHGCWEYHRWYDYNG
ncbi:MAG: hypothetical protein GC159_03585 [Phycisphaera sp.]|nr:hypothetical protein [Phycisphaera sp.]